MDNEIKFTVLVPVYAKEKAENFKLALDSILNQTLFPNEILIIEDEVAIADLEKDYLELSGFEVEIENDGTNGLARAHAEDFDLFILDLMLPGIDGFEICKEIREKKNTPILMK